MSTFRLLTIASLWAASAWAHCDSLDGPVARAAMAALDNGDVRPALIWTQPVDEQEIRAAFAKSAAVRQFGGEAKVLADTYFVETLVRLHRAGEGAPFTGLKPAGRDLGPAIPAADAALAGGSPERLSRLLAAAVEHGLKQRFEAASHASKRDPADVEAGRAFVKAYVEFLHYAERVYAAAATGPAHAHDDK